MNVGVIDFLKELFTNNKPLLFSEREIPVILNHVVSACDKMPASNFYKGKLVDFLRVLIIFNSKAIRTN
jgi:inositol 1,4,5-triphosphate receptor type 1/inositol 1,4,5-triphosphate receptor type 3